VAHPGADRQRSDTWLDLGKGPEAAGGTRPGLVKPRTLVAQVAQGVAGTDDALQATGL
jgi:hypothetical protein